MPFFVIILYQSQLISMVRFYKLAISADGETLSIDVNLPNYAEYPDAYISRITIDTQDTYIDDGPSSTPVYTYNTTPAFQGDLVRDVVLELTKEDIPLNFNDTIFFVYVLVEGLPVDYNPCCADMQPTTMRTVVNTYPYYQIMMAYLKDVEKSCQIPQALIDYYFRFKAFEISIITGNYNQAIQFWNKYLKGIKAKAISHHACACNYGLCK